MKINRHSVLFKINIVFILSFAVLLFFYLFAHKIINRVETFKFLRKAVFLVKKNKLKDAEMFGINLLKNKKNIDKILKNGKIILRRNPPRLNYTLNLLSSGGNKYLYFKSKTGTTNLLLQRISGINERQNVLLAAWIGLNVILILLYISIFRSIRPLKKLRDNIEEFKNGNIYVDLGGYASRKDEIGFLAKEFKEAVDNLKKTMNTRVWFIRNIAHELKTPITKGKIALELLKDEDENKKRIFSDIFNRLEMLINELFAAEKIAAGSEILNMNACSLKDVIDRATELLFVKNDGIISVISDNTNYTVKADCELLSIAIKNLLDNAVKFKTNEESAVTVNIEKGVLNIINEGAKPSISEDAMFEPFAKDINAKNKDGFGLGLYITKQIIEKHGLKIIYEYTGGKNIFKIDLNKIQI
ncbi:MAG: HAMP domain-containing histidine kinase [Candidatus Acidulodesulfobacterium acidiphilum]|uniref:histidine kinase n=1 Tax=Candidatus Acidulodesulfobacterium acidiphilum TaxID=2597224 RepID=A0A520XGL5_9DELT|nr:MAG: HAMP domain-containing histidine kinase [Candidatus Acidulodesulfobacterium acidiphilum]